MIPLSLHWAAHGTSRQIRKHVMQSDRNLHSACALCNDRWFHDTLVDGDLAINSMMWQNAGKSGLDQWNFTLLPTSSSQVLLLACYITLHLSSA